MKHFIIEHSDEEFYTSTSGISLVGLGLNRFTNLAASLAKAVPLSHGISHADVIRSFCALLAQGKSDYAAIEQHRKDDFFREALRLSQVPSEATLRQRMDDHAAEFLRVVSWAIVEFLMKAEVPLTSLYIATLLWTSTVSRWTTPARKKSVSAAAGGSFS